MSGPDEEDHTVVDGKPPEPDTSGATVVDAALHAELVEVTNPEAPPLFTEPEATRVELPKPTARRAASAARARQAADEATTRGRPAPLERPAGPVPREEPPPRWTVTSPALRAMRQLHPLVMVGLVVAAVLLVLLGLNSLLRESPANRRPNPDEPGLIRRLLNW